MEFLNVVIIGRNEGRNIQQCVLSSINNVHQVIYVDSGSTDESVTLAKKNGAAVIELDTDLPFTAARGRNFGFSYLMNLNPATKYVQFVDGDCELMDGWLETAVHFLQKYEKYAVVCGHLRERYPKISIYNRLCDIEWNGVVGAIDACGGIFMIRASAFEEIGGMNVDIIAGEEPEMCLRLRKKGWLIARIDREMAWHDADITSFRQWWKRAIRSGCGAIDVFKRTEGQVFETQVKRTRFWTIGWSLALLCALGLVPIVGGFVYPSIAALCIIALYPLQVLRVAMRMYSKGLSIKESAVCGGLMMVSKWAELYGHCFHYLSSKKKQGKANRVAHFAER